MFGVTGLRVRQLPSAYSALRRTAQLTLWGLFWLVGHVCGGAITGALAGWAGSLVPAAARRTALLVLALGCAVWALEPLGLFRLRMPHFRRQAPRDWMKRLPWNLVALGYGIQLGCAFATHVTIPTTYAAIGCAVLTGSPWRGAVIMGLFGAARGLLPLIALPRTGSPLAALPIAARMDRLERVVALVNGVLLAAAAVLLANSWRLSAEIRLP